MREGGEKPALPEMPSRRLCAPSNEFSDSHVFAPSEGTSSLCSSPRKRPAVLRNTSVSGNRMTPSSRLHHHSCNQAVMSKNKKRGLFLFMFILSDCLPCSVPCSESMPDTSLDSLIVVALEWYREGRGCQSLRHQPSDSKGKKKKKRKKEKTSN